MKSNPETTHLIHIKNRLFDTYCMSVKNKFQYRNKPTLIHSVFKINCITVGMRQFIEKKTEDQTLKSLTKIMLLSADKSLTS